MQFLRRFIVMREQLFSDLVADYVIIDTSPGIRYWSIKCSCDSRYTVSYAKVRRPRYCRNKKMVGEIYSSFTKFGAKPYLILNKVAGYCVPHSSVQRWNNIQPVVWGAHYQLQLSLCSKRRKKKAV